jgi:hypothetical protein
MTSETKPGTWVNIDAGPRMAKAFDKALRDLRWEGKTFVQVLGVVGDPASEHRYTLTSPFDPTIRQDVQDELDVIGLRYDFRVTAATYKAIVADLEAATAECAKHRPEHDERRTAEEEAERLAYAAERDLAHKVATEVRSDISTRLAAMRPVGAKACIVAILKRDQSDTMTDYFHNTSDRRVAIGWRFTTREDFRVLRAAAASFPETAHLASVEALTAWAEEQGEHMANYLRRNGVVELEHRDNYSMGAGNYLSDHGWDGSGSGWIVRSEGLDPTVEEIHLPDPATSEHVDTTGGGVTVRPSSVGREGFVEVVFAAKPDESVRAGLKSHGFRWAKSTACWYGRDVAYAEGLLPR